MKQLDKAGLFQVRTGISAVRTGLSLRFNHSARYKLAKRKGGEQGHE